MAIINGNDASNQLNGTNLADQIFGRGGADALEGLDGDDLLEGGAGADKLFGSGGLDLASYKSSPARVSVDLEQHNAFGGHAQGDQLLSIEGAIGSAYGDSFFANDERNVFRGEGGSDTFFDYGGDDLLFGGGGNDEFIAGAGADELRGGSGIDIAYYDDSEQSVLIDLAAGTGFGGIAEGDRLFSIENVAGSDLGDLLAGNGGTNVLTGDYGADNLVGRGGADKFDYNDTGDSYPQAGADFISDFSRVQGDKIDLSTIDARVHTTGNQAFTFIGQGQFTGEGQLRFYQQNSDTFIEANTDNSVTGAEMVIVLGPPVTLQGGDFVL